jgi:hypothetical protein
MERAMSIAKELKADTAGVDAADDPVDGSPFPDGGGIHARAGSQLLSPRPEVGIITLLVAALALFRLRRRHPYRAALLANPGAAGRHGLPVSAGQTAKDA